MRPRRPKGVASVVGMLFLVLIFTVAVGTQVYMSGLQSQAFQAGQQAQQVMDRHSAESLTYSGTGQGLSATDTGPASVQVVALILKFENGTVYDLNSASSPAFVSSWVASSGTTQVSPLVPAGRCSPGAATCLSKYNTIVGGGAVGRAVGLVTSLGNTFWYVPFASSGQTSSFYRTSSVQSTTSSAWVGIQGLSFTGASNSLYTVQVYISYWQSNSANPVINFAIAVPSGATFLFCGGMFWADPSQATTDFTPGNLCTGSTNFALGPTHNTQSWCTATNTACEFVGTAFVSFGAPSGSFQLEFEGAASDTANVAIDSVIVVTHAG